MIVLQVFANIFPMPFPFHKLCLPNRVLSLIVGIGLLDIIFSELLENSEIHCAKCFWKRNIVYFALELLYVIAVLRKFVSASLFSRSFRLLPICLRLMSPWWYHGTVSAWVLHICHCHVLLLFESFCCVTTHSSYFYTQLLSAVALCFSWYKLFTVAWPDLS